ncbi:MAG: MFS transporter [Chloroflexi bacterium]|nr:MFS transporter [Chloroflexota bacterium]
MIQQAKRVPRNVWVLSGVSFLRDIASEMLIHLLPLFLANVLGVRTGIIGLIEGVAETTASLVKIYSGWLSDKLGRRKGLTATGYGLAALATPLLLIANSWPVILLYRFIDRLGKGIRTAPRDALIADSISAQHRGIAFGLHRAADTGGAFVGLLLAIWLVWRSQTGALLLNASTFHTVVSWALLPAFLAVVVLLWGVKEIAKPTQATPPKFSLRGFDRRYRRFLVVMVLFTLGNSTDAFLILRAQSAGASVLLVLAMIAGFNLVYSLLATPAGALSDRIERRKVMVGGWLLYAVVYLGFAGAHSTWHFWLLYALYGVYYAFTEGVAKAVVADMAPSEQRGAAFGVYHAAIGLTVLPASVIAGLLWQGAGGWLGFGPAAPFLFGGGLSVVAAILLWRWVR